MQSIADGLEEVESDKLVAHIAVLAQLVLRVPDAFESKSDVITKFLLKQVILASPPVDEVLMAPDSDDEDLCLHGAVDSEDEY